MKPVPFALTYAKIIECDEAFAPVHGAADQVPDNSTVQPCNGDAENCPEHKKEAMREHDERFLGPEFRNGDAK
jgi:hypothetical protein